MKRNIEEVVDSAGQGGGAEEYSNNLEPGDALIPHMGDFDSVQKEILTLDERCANEQMEIQRKYDKIKQPLFDRRQDIIDKIPGFWAKAILNHPALSYVTSADMPILECLRAVDLKDNLDNNGSYKVTLHFTEKANEFFTPLSITKHVEFSGDKETVVECTTINWKPGKSPIEAAQKAREGNRCIDWSIFEWFTADEWLNRPDFGEVIRRELWHAPLAYYTDSVEIDYLDDDYSVLDGDEDDDEEKEDYIDTSAKVEG